MMLRCLLDDKQLPSSFGWCEVDDKSISKSERIKENFDIERLRIDNFFVT